MTSGNDTPANEQSSERTQDNEFNFDQWVTNIGLNRKATQVLRSQDCVCRESLSLLSDMDVKSLGLTLGQSKLLEVTLKQLRQGIG